MLVGSPSATAKAAGDGAVWTLTISDDGSTLNLRFDEPVTQSDVAAVEEALTGDFVAASSTTTSVAAFDPDAKNMWCGSRTSHIDSNGTLTLDRRCGTYRDILWSYRISTAVKAIIVSNVSETGLWYWIDGVRQPRNAPHNVPDWYTFHGRMYGVNTGEYVQYQDYMTFRHNVGPGGTGSITFAGHVNAR